MSNEELDLALREGILSRTKLNDMLVQIIAASDTRMKHTNTMVEKLSATMKICVKEYATHLESLKKCREDLQSIINKQQDTISLLQEDLRKERKRNDDLIDKMLLRPNINMQQ